MLKNNLKLQNWRWKLLHFEKEPDMCQMCNGVTNKASTLSQNEYGPIIQLIIRHTKQRQHDRCSSPVWDPISYHLEAKPKFTRHGASFETPRKTQKDLQTLLALSALLLNLKCQEFVCHFFFGGGGSGSCYQMYRFFLIFGKCPTSSSFSDWGFNSARRKSNVTRIFNYHGLSSVLVYITQGKATRKAKLCFILISLLAAIPTLLRKSYSWAEQQKLPTTEHATDHTCCLSLGVPQNMAISQLSRMVTDELIIFCVQIELRRWSHLNLVNSIVQRAHGWQNGCWTCCNQKT